MNNTMTFVVYNPESHEFVFRCLEHVRPIISALEIDIGRFVHFDGVEECEVCTVQ